jgi:hypothetical protein
MKKYTDEGKCETFRYKNNCTRWMVMKKFILIIVLTLLVFFAKQSVVYTMDDILELPDIKIIINGELKKYSDVPLSISQRTMLPLRELLVQLGVENDDEHIVWDDVEKSVTIYKEDIKVYLKLGDPTAYVDDLPITLDAPPFGYSKNERVYIPVRFVSQALGKKVAWDGTTKTVLIRDEDEFNHIKGILENTASAMERVNKAKIKSEMSMNILKQGTNISFITDMTTLVDKSAKKMSQDIQMPLSGQMLEFKSYYVDNSVYENNALAGKWEKRSLPAEEFDKLLNESMLSVTANSGELLCAGLVEVPSDSFNEALLRGNMFPQELFSRMSKNIEVSKLQLDNCYFEIVLDKDTGLIKRSYTNIRGTYFDDNGNSRVESQIISTYSDYNGDFVVGVPEELVVETHYPANNHFTPAH